jgi:hypothetical protein
MSGLSVRDLRQPQNGPNVYPGFIIDVHNHFLCIRLSTFGM